MNDTPVTEQSCAYVALLGAPNAGKSTLLNRLTGSKVAITSPKAQTTRSRILGICTHEGAQLVFMDLPGVFSAKQRFEQSMVACAWGGAEEADTVLLLVDASLPRISKDTRLVVDGLKLRGRKATLLLNKVDAADKPSLLALASELNESGVFEDIFMISAQTGDGVEDLREYLIKRAPQGAWLYPPDQMTDISERLWAAEITREQVFRQLQQELPYVCAVETENWEQRKNGDIAVHQVLYVQKEGHKKILLGKGGERIKSIGMASRRELSSLLLSKTPEDRQKKRGPKLHLFLHIKVKPDWKEDPAIYRMMGLDF